MTAVPDYVGQLLRRQRDVGNSLGVYTFGTARELYVINATLMTVIGVLMKRLADKGVVSDAEWVDSLNHALDGAWPSWIAAQVDPDAIPQ